MRELVEEFGTGFLHTAISREAGAYCWERRPGPDRLAQLGRPTTEVRAALAGLVRMGSELALPKVVGNARKYAVPGRVTAAKVILSPGGTAHREHLEHAVDGVGQVLAALAHEVPARLASASPSGPARLAAWMERGAGPAAAGQLYEAFRRRLGVARWRRVQAWCQAIGTPSDDDVFLHGAPSLGSVVLGEDGHSWCLLIGEECARGPQGFDVGWLLGEFAEVKMVLGHANGAAMPMADYDEIRNSLLHAHGPVANATLAGRAAVLRVFTHAHDFAAYMGWHPELHAYGEKIAELIDDEGADALRSSQRV